MNVSVQLAGRFREMSNFDKEIIMNDIERFTEKHERLVDNGELHLIMKQHKEKFRTIPLFHCTARFVSNIGRFNATGHEYGIKQTVDQALGKIEKQVIKTKQKAEDYRLFSPSPRTIMFEH